jgi:hypothetical protein
LAVPIESARLLLPKNTLVVYQRAGWVWRVTESGATTDSYRLSVTLSQFDDSGGVLAPIHLDGRNPLQSAKLVAFDAATSFRHAICDKE